MGEHMFCHIYIVVNMQSLCTSPVDQMDESRVRWATFAHLTRTGLKPTSRCPGSIDCANLRTNFGSSIVVMVLKRLPFGHDGMAWMCISGKRWWLEYWLFRQPLVLQYLRHLLHSYGTSLPQRVTVSPSCGGAIVFQQLCRHGLRIIIFFVRFIYLFLPIF